MKYILFLLLLNLSVHTELNRLNFSIQIENNTHLVILKVKKESLFIEDNILYTLRECVVSKVIRGKIAQKKIKLIQGNKEVSKEERTLFQKYNLIEKFVTEKHSKYIFFFNKDHISGKFELINSENRLFLYDESYDRHIKHYSERQVKNLH